MMIKLIGGTAGLLVETGRWRGMAREVRVCKECRSGEVEDVEHWLLRCAAWKTFQKPLLARVQQLQEGAWSCQDGCFLLSYMDVETANFIHDL